MAKLYFRYGSMSASKSANLLMSAHNYEERGMRCAIFNYAKDKRFGEGMVASRIGISKKSIPFDADLDFFETISKIQDREQVSCIFIDESQFLNKKQVEQLTNIVDVLRIPVICYGLRTDFKSELFEGSKWLLAWADTIEEIKTVCWCNRKATFVARIDVKTGRMLTEGEQIEIGHSQYIALCREHWKGRITERPR